MISKYTGSMGKPETDKGRSYRIAMTMEMLAVMILVRIRSGFMVWY